MADKVLTALNDISASLATYVAGANSNGLLGKVSINTIKAIIGASANLTVSTATPTTNPGANTGNRMWIAATAGTYTNFSGITIGSEEIAFLVDTGTAPYVKVTFPWSAPTATSFLYGSLTKNIFDPSAVVTGSYIDPSTGNVTAAAVYSMSGYIPVNPSTTYTVSGYSNAHWAIGIAFYDATNTKISNTSAAANLTTFQVVVPSGAASFRMTVKTTNSSDTTTAANIQVEVGTTATSFEAYSKGILKVNGTALTATSAAGTPVNSNDVVPLWFYNANTPTNAVSKTTDLTKVPVGKNLFQPSLITAGAYINSTNGAYTTTADTNYTCSGYISVISGQQYTISGLSTSHYALGVAYYDASNALVGFGGSLQNVANFTITIPGTAVSFRFTVHTAAAGDTTNAANVQVEKGTSATTFEANKMGISNIAGTGLAADQTSGKTPSGPNDIISYSFLQQYGVIPATIGKKALIFGDSITEYTSGRPNWPSYAMPILGVTSYSNRARSGASFTDWAYTDAPEQQLSVQINNAITAGDVCDFVVISIGTNDYSRQSLLGDYATAMGKTSLASLDRAKILEAARWAFWTIRTQWPSAKCFYGMPIQRAAYESAETQWFRDAIRQMCNRYSFTVIEAHTELDIVKDFEVLNNVGRYLYDGLHCSPAGQALMGKFYAKAIANKYFN